MLEHLSKRFAGKLICAGIISEADADVYVYGFFQGMMLLLNVITTLLLGILFQKLLLCMLLNATYQFGSALVVIMQTVPFDAISILPS
mgnify:CR=1 FL=1